MSTSIRWIVLACFLLAPREFHAQNTKSVVLEALRAEMSRSIEHFKKMPSPPYFLSYEVVETEQASALGSYGALAGSSPVVRQRMLGIDLRVGSHALDNTHPIRGAMPNFPDTFSFYQLPVDDDSDAIRALIWYYTDQKYKRAVEQFISVKTNVQVKAPETDTSGERLHS